MVSGFPGQMKKKRRTRRTRRGERRPRKEWRKKEDRDRTGGGGGKGGGRGWENDSGSSGAFVSKSRWLSRQSTTTREALSVHAESPGHKRSKFGKNRPRRNGGRGRTQLLTTQIACGRSGPSTCMGMRRFFGMSTCAGQVYMCQGDLFTCAKATNVRG